MASHTEHDELAPSQTEGFKVGEKKTLEELHNLDQNDDSLRRWKESLGVGPNSTAATDEPAKVSILALTLAVEGRPDVVVDLKGGDPSAALKNNVFKIKEGATFRLKVKFRVFGQIISGLKYIQVVKKHGITVGRDEEMLGSYIPNSQGDSPFYEKTIAAEEAPSGFTGRGGYKAASRFIDDDKTTHLQLDWAFEVVKKWDDE